MKLYCSFIAILSIFTCFGQGLISNSELTLQSPDKNLSVRFAANDNRDKVAFTYGRIVLAGVMGAENFIHKAPHSNPLLYNYYYAYNYNVPAGITKSLTLDTTKLNSAIKPLSGQNLTFKTIKEGVLLRPLYDIHRERYVVYWDFKK